MYILNMATFWIQVIIISTRTPIKMISMICLMVSLLTKIKATATATKVVVVMVSPVLMAL